MEVIADNAGYDGAVAVDEVLQLEGRVGFNAATGEYEDLVAVVVIDPLKVTRSALRHAGSAAAMLITSEAVVGDTPSYHRWNDYYRERLAKEARVLHRRAAVKRQRRLGQSNCRRSTTPRLPLKFWSGAGNAPWRTSRGVVA